MYLSLLALILRLHVPLDAPKTDELQRLSFIAYAIAKETEANPGALPPKVLAAATLSLFWGESRLARGVHAGERTRWGSDLGRAKCLGQLHDTGVLEPGEWESLAGTDLESTRRCARATIRVLQRFARWCRYDGTDESLARVYGAYGTGAGCKTTVQARRRVKILRRFERALQRGQL